MGTLSYSSNNSGGYWWLTDENWKAMERAGWSVEWMANQETYGGIGLDKDGRWLGALAKYATIETDDPEWTMFQWERITGQNRHDSGCSCCGQPHNFSYEDGKGGYEYY
jgi:hypothetical protein